jgi:hypothetical protein
MRKTVEEFMNKCLYGWVPAIMAGAMFVIFLLFYHCERDIKKLQENA